jgi:hypothetical protein
VGLNHLSALEQGIKPPVVAVVVHSIPLVVAAKFLARWVVVKAANRLVAVADAILQNTGVMAAIVGVVVEAAEEVVVEAAEAEDVNNQFKEAA